MHISIRKLLQYAGHAFACLLLVVLAGCQNTGLGLSVESAVAPRSVESSNVSLPQDFPDIIPIYRPTILKDLQRSPLNNPTNVAARWSSKDSANLVVRFYRDRLAQNNWRMLLNPTESDRGTFLGQNRDLLVTVSIQPEADRTDILMQYVKSPQLLSSNASGNPTDPNSNSPSSSTTNPGIFSNPGLQIRSRSELPSQPFSGKFSDFDSVPAPLHAFIQDLTELGILQPKQGSQFEPNISVTRRQYVAWLVATNNRIYSNNPSRQIRLPQAAPDRPIFADVPVKDPDFSAIQALVNAGLISASPDPAKNLFKPDDPLTRETLVLWKVPLDLRRPLPTATVEAVKQAWGFQDSDRISPDALRAVLADFASGDLSNIRRSFGYTIVFQPQKPVTRAEAAAALWYFGTLTDGLSAQRVLQQERAAAKTPESQSSDRTVNSPSPQPSVTNSPSPSPGI
ncbi:S-layer homology domain-containing protein [Pseudanabaena sp. PCC 6802]|uniref:S-layer homology domain-containing protein n=1 Tax=Pseudanabaena sp. PCC 6802 TaxID=118173 RepID=UPI00034ADDB5|nr:S-layer homology domain-containing protein [Pseudanabaena sp. PCC 6802]